MKKQDIKCNNVGYHNRPYMVVISINVFRAEHKHGIVMNLYQHFVEF